MKESRVIIIILAIMGIVLIPFGFLLKLLSLDGELCINIITNLECGVIVGLVTAICQYFMAKRRIINAVYGLYFELYTTYYTVRNKELLHHINTLAFFNKLTELSSKIKDSLSEYHGFFKKNDSVYMIMNPQINMGENYKAEKMIKTLVKWFNEKSVDKSIEPFINEVENILKGIVKKDFKKIKSK